MKKTKKKTKNVAKFMCCNCKHEYTGPPGPTQCPKCSHLYVIWLNYNEKWADLQ